MATGTGKTVVAFQICWKLWNARWNRTGDYRRPRMLYLADRTSLSISQRMYLCRVWRRPAQEDVICTKRRAGFCGGGHRIHERSSARLFYRFLLPEGSRAEAILELCLAKSP